MQKQKVKLLGYLYGFKIAASQLKSLLFFLLCRQSQKISIIENNVTNKKYIIYLF